MHLKNRHKILIFILLWPFFSLGQETSAWLVNDVNQKIRQFHLQNPGTSFHSGVMPYIISDSLNNALFPKTGLKITPRFGNKKSSISIIPLVQLSGGIEISDSTHFIGQLGIGLAIRGNLGKKWDYYASAYFEALDVPFYVQDYIYTNGVVPGMGQAYGGLLTNNFSRFDGYLRFKPVKIFYIEFGLGKQFIGVGYRSLLWSDFAINSPYFKLNLNAWHLNFSATYSYLNDYSQNTVGTWQTAGKYIARHYISWNISKTVHLGLFESVVWQTRDGEYHRGFDFNYLNPIVLYRPTEFSIGSADNSLLGLDFNVDFCINGPFTPNLCSMSFYCAK